MFDDELDGLVWSADRLRRAPAAAGVALWSWNVDTGALHMDRRAYALWGVPRGGPLTFETLSRHIVPPDRARVRAVIEATRSRPGPYEVDFRIWRDDEVCWISARGLGADEGIVERVMFGIFLDVTERKRVEETRELLAAEMSHRVKNLFAIASSLAAIAARSAATPAAMAVDLARRLSALAGAHELLRLDPEREGRQAALLDQLFAVFLAPYDEAGAIGDRVRVSLPSVRVGEGSATALALIVHELATNSAKYGALSRARGTLDVTSSEHDGALAIAWTERGGPRVSAPTGPRGFGSKLVTRSVAGQFGGRISYDWQAAGVAITLRVSRARLAD